MVYSRYWRTQNRKITHREKIGIYASTTTDYTPQVRIQTFPGKFLKLGSSLGSFPDSMALTTMMTLLVPIPITTLSATRTPQISVQYPLLATASLHLPGSIMNSLQHSVVLRRHHRIYHHHNPRTPANRRSTVCLPIHGHLK